MVSCLINFRTLYKHILKINFSNITITILLYYHLNSFIYIFLEFSNKKAYSSYSVLNQDTRS